jgi:hypothetical protein
MKNFIMNMQQENKLDGFIIVDDGTLPISKEGSLFVGWMEMRLKECIEVEDYEEAEKLKRDIQKARDNMMTSLVLKNGTHFMSQKNGF